MEENIITMTTEEFYNEDIGFEFNMVSHIFYAYDLEKIHVLDKLLPNTIWSGRDLEDGSTLWFNEWNINSNKFIFSSIAYSPDCEYIITETD